MHQHSPKDEFQQLDERMKLALDANRDVVWDWDLINNELYVSQKWKDIIGHDESKTPYKIEIWKKHLHPEDARRVLDDISKNICGESEYIDNIHRLRDKDGKWLWIHMRGKTYFDEQGRALRATGTHRNITKLKELELKNLQQEQIINQIHESVIAIDLDGSITDYNRGSEMMLGYSSSEMLGKDILKICAPEDRQRFSQSIQQLMQKNKNMELEIHFRTKSRKIIDVELVLSLLLDERGKALKIIASSHDVTEKKRAHENLLKQKEELNYQAHHDILTGLPNRTLFYKRLEMSLQKADIHSKKVALLFLDLDKFKEINDSYGHDIGDMILQLTSQKLLKNIRKEDTLARIAGDEFIIILEDIDTIQEAFLVAQKILRSFEDKFIVQGSAIEISMSIGISLYPDHAQESEALIKAADRAMYRVKREGRGSFEFYSLEEDIFSQKKEK